MLYVGKNGETLDDINYQPKSKAQLLAEHEAVLVKEREKILAEERIKYRDIEQFVNQLILIVIPPAWIQIIQFNGGVFKVGERGVAYKKHLETCKIKYQLRKKIKEFV